MTGGGLRAFLGLSLLAVIGACEGGEVIVFSPAQAGAPGPGASGNIGGSSGGLAGSGGTGSGGVAGNPLDRACQSNDDCDLSWFCQKQACSDATGVCSPIPILDDGRLLPVCGCDRVT